MAKIDLLKASFKNSIFYVKKESIKNIGLKQIQHGYPNTNIQYIESQGDNPFSATIDIFFGNKDDFDFFCSSMREETPGRLILPVYGIVNNVKCMPADADIDYKNIGKYSMSVTFMETVDRPSPTIADTTISDITNNAESIRQLAKENFKKSFTIPSSILNVTAIISDSIVLSSVIFNIIKNKIISDLLAVNFRKNIQNPELLAAFLFGDDETTGLLQDIANTIVDFEMFKKIAIIGNNLPIEMYDILSGDLLKYDFGNSNARELNFNIAKFDVGTLEREERNNNRILIINTFRIIGLIGMLESASNYNYKISDEITKTMQDIELYFSNIIDNDTTGILIDDLKNDLNILKGKTFEVLQQKKQNAFNSTIITINNYISASLLAYKLYGEYIKNETDLEFYSELLRGMNKQCPGHLLLGQINVVEVA